jgi:hypothetical protein
MTRPMRRAVQADIVLPVSAVRACDRLARAFDDAARVHLAVGPRRGTHFPAKRVHGTLTGPSHRGSTYVFSLTWEPVGFGAAAYPTLDAKVGVTPIDATTSLLSIVAHYEPPFGTVGATADRAAMSRVADATVSSLLHRLAHAITHAPSPMVGV